MNLNIVVTILNIIALVLWLFAGLFNLIKREEIDKISYGLMWSVLIMNLIVETIRQILS